MAKIAGWDRDEASQSFSISIKIANPKHPEISRVFDPANNDSIPGNNSKRSFVFGVNNCVEQSRFLQIFTRMTP